MTGNKKAHIIALTTDEVTNAVTGCVRTREQILTLGHFMLSCLMRPQSGSRLHDSGVVSGKAADQGISRGFGNHLDVTGGGRQYSRRFPVGNHVSAGADTASLQVTLSVATTMTSIPG